MGLSQDDVRKVAMLARLELSDGELDRMTGDLGTIVAYIDLLSEVDTDDVAPMAHPLDVSNVLVDDRIRPSLDRQVALSSAPRHDGTCYLVPAVLGD